MFCLPDGLDWERDGANWPNRQASRFVTAAGLRWHVQETGSGPVLLLVHGTGAATHSWRGLMPLLARHFTVIAPDLPGHGFTGMPEGWRLSLAGMSGLLGALLEALDRQPVLALGHSAGAAILIRMTLDRRLSPRGIVSVNGALLPFPGAAGFIFPQVARLLFLNPLAPRMFAWSAQDEVRVRRLIRETGSSIDEAGIELYARLFRNGGHVAAALGMMASWDLRGLKARMPSLRTPLLLMAGEADAAVPPDVARQVGEVVDGARVLDLPGLGHLAHEERPEAVVRPVLDFAGQVQTRSSSSPGGTEGGLS